MSSFIWDWRYSTADNLLFAIDSSLFPSTTYGFSSLIRRDPCTQTQKESQNTAGYCPQIKNKHAINLPLFFIAVLD